MIPDYIETTPSAITKKQGGQLWLVSCAEGLMCLYKTPQMRFNPITVFIRSQGRVEARVMWVHPDGMTGYEF